MDRVDTKKGGTPLFGAVQSKNMELVQFFIDKGANVFRRFDGERPMLHLAAQQGSPEIINCLCKTGLDVNILDELGGTAARWAAQNGHIESVKLLRNLGCDVLRGDTSGWTPLHAAASSGKFDMVNYLLEIGVLPNKESLLYGTPVLCAVRAKDSKTLGLLLEKGGEPLTSIVRIAMLNGDRACLEEIILRLDRFSSFAEKFREGGAMEVALAFQNGKKDVARMLLDAGCDLKGLSIPDAKNLLFTAVENQCPNVLLRLADGQIDLQMKLEESLLTPVHIASQLGDAHTLKTLINLGFPVSSESQYGQTALHYAARGGPEEVVKMLAGTINPLLKDINGRIALHWAAIGGHAKAVRLLSKTPGAAGTRDRNKQTPLHVACEEGRAECVKSF